MDIKIRIFIRGESTPIYRYVSSQAPQRGDIICIETDKAKVKSVEWWILNHKPHADIVCNYIKK